MEFFTPIPEAQAIIANRGVYRQVSLYTRGGKVYAKIGSGFIRMMQGGTMSTPHGKWLEIDVPEGEAVESQGYLTYTETKLIGGAS
jgi:hypothetical protein